MAAREQLDRVIDGFRPRFPAVAALLTAAESDLLAHLAFPEPHRRQIRSTNPHRAAQQGDQAPDRGGRDLLVRASVIRLVGMILAEQDDEWQDGRRYVRPQTLVLMDAEPEPGGWCQRYSWRVE